MNIKEGEKRGLGTLEGARARGARDAQKRGFSRAVDLGTVALGFLFGGCHLAFGAYPLGIALVAALPYRVWYALVGVIFGSLLQGRSGVIYAMVSLLAVLLRIIISGAKPKSAKEGDGESARRDSFSEGIPLRICAAVISSFVAALYEILLSGISWTGVLFGVSMMLISAIGTAVFSGAFLRGVGVRDLILSKNRIFVRGENARERFTLTVFRISLLGFILAASLSFSRFNIFGVDLSFVFAAAITMFTAKRFGALYGAVVGFVSTVGISGIYSPAMLIGGAAAGALFTFGMWFAVAAAGIGIGVFCAYIGGVSGFLTVLPEYLVAVSLMIPLFRYLERESAPENRDTLKRRATDMVGTMALSYRSRKASCADGIEELLSSASRTILSYLGDGDGVSASSLAALMHSCRTKALNEREMNENLTEKADEVFSRQGFAGGMIRVFGNERPHVICAAEDKDGDRISSPEFRRELEAAVGVALSEPEYYRRDEMVVMVADSAKSFSLEGAYATAAGKRSEVSGDTLKIFESENGFAYGLISDGMGSGEEARRTSEFIVGLFSAAGNCSDPSDVMGIVNSCIRSRGEECGATVDAFGLDLVTGGGFFIKSGAAASFIKRGSSLYKINSSTLPIGVMKEVDAERITASVEDGDYIIMTSDGVFCDEESPWLVELLHKPNKRTLREYAAYILEQAESTVGTDDDRSVMVLRVKKLYK